MAANNVAALFCFWRNLYSGFYKHHNGVNAYAEKTGILYLDLNLSDSELQMDWSRDSKEQGDHLNVYGAIKVSRYLGKYLKSNYNLPDRRMDKEFGDCNLPS